MKRCRLKRSNFKIINKMSKENQTSDKAQNGNDFIADVSNSTVDLSKCKKGDTLISTHGAKLEYVAPTPWKHYTYLDHVVKYIEDADGKSFGKDNYGTRTNDGFTFAKNRKPETDHDILKVL